MRVSGSGLEAAASNIVGKTLKIIFGLLMVAIVLAIGFGIYFVFELNQAPSNVADPVPFDIQQGQTFDQITNNLYDNHFIRNTFVFRVRGQNA